MSPVRAALHRLRARRGRTALAALGIAAAAMMVGTAVTLGYGLQTGFDRATQRADLPDVIARIQPRTRAEVNRRLDGLANVEARSNRFELKRVALSTPGGSSRKGVVQLVPRRSRRGYALVEGRDIGGRPGEMVVERGVAREWGVSVGGRVRVGRGGDFEVVGIAVGPDDVAFPLTSTPRVYLSEEAASPEFLRRGRSVNVVMLWASDPSRLDSLLVQARTQSFGLENLRFVTRDGVRALIDQAAGIVIALLIAFSVIALVAAGVMLGASARTDVQRQLPSIGVMRAVGVSRGGIAGRYALDSALVALPAAAIGLLAGAAVASGPSGRLLEILNELPPGAALAGPLLGCLTAIVALAVLATVAPAWRAAGRPPAHLLRGAELRHVTRTARTPSGPLGLGIRLALTRRGRTLATAAVVAASTGVVLLMLALAVFLQDLRDDPGTVGKRYDLTAALPASATRDVQALPGVRAAAPRYEVDALDSLDLGQQLKVIAFPGDHTTFEAPPLSEGRRVTADGEAEVGLGLAQTLGLRPGSGLTVQLASGGEARFRVVGVVRTIEDDGRVAYVRPPRLLAAAPGTKPKIAIRLDDGAGASSLTPALARLGAEPSPVAAATTDNRAFLSVLAGVLWVVAGVNGLVCLYVLSQALALIAVERRATIAVLRASGAGRSTIALLLLGVALVVVAIAAPLGILVQRLVLGPAVARLAAGFTALPLGAGPAAVAGVCVFLVLVAAGAALWVARRVEHEPIAAALRDS